MSVDKEQLQDYARLNPDLVIDAVEATGRLSDARVLALNSYENRVYQVGIDEAEPLIAKFYRPGRWTDEQIREEHTFSRELRDADLPVVAPLANDDGTSLFFHDQYRFALFPRKGGRAPEAGDLEQLYRMGLLIGRMHGVARTASFLHRPRLDIASFIEQPVALLLQGFIPADLRTRYESITGVLLGLLQASGLEQAAVIRAHGDMHPGNILWTRDDGPWLVDFDDCRSAPAVQDLWMLLGGERHEQEVQLAELLAGYEEFCDFDRAELSLIEPLRALRIVHYAGWLATRWSDPAFPQYFPWFNTSSYWLGHLNDLEQQCERLRQPPLRCFG